MNQPGIPTPQMYLQTNCNALCLFYLFISFGNILFFRCIASYRIAPTIPIASSPNLTSLDVPRLDDDDVFEAAEMAEVMIVVYV